MGALDTDPPQFAIALRGYDRVQVDDYIDRLRNYAAELESRVQQAQAGVSAANDELERLRSAPLNATELPSRLASILQLAEEEAKAIRLAAEREAEEILHRAQEEADEHRRRSEEELVRALRDGDALRAKLDAEATHLRSLKANFVEELERLSEVIRAAAEAAGRPDRVEEDKGAVAWGAPPSGPLLALDAVNVTRSRDDELQVD